MKKLSTLLPGDTVEIIAPSSRCASEQVEGVKNLLESWQLNCLVPPDLFGEDLLCANSDKQRFKHLKNALLRPETKAVISVRGGYGSMRLIPDLQKVTPPAASKIFLGMSDTTALQLYLQQEWKWPTVHGALISDRFSPESINSVKSILLGETKQVEFQSLEPLNQLATKNHTLVSQLIGGNLCLVQTGIGTPWQLKAANHIVFLEEVGERGYRVDRMLEHLSQAKIFKDVKAIIFGDFFQCEEPNGSSLIADVLKRFAESCPVPVVRVKNIGHGYENLALPLGITTQLQLGNELKLICNIQE